MSAWGEGPLESDQGLDWLGDVYDGFIGAIAHLLDTYEQSLGDQGAERYGMQMRTAAWLAQTLDGPGSYGVLLFHRPDLRDRLIRALERIRDSEWAKTWTDPEAFNTSIEAQITALKENA